MYVEKYNEIATLFKTQQEMANAFGCSQPLVYKWLSGKQVMTAHFAIKAEKITGGEIKAIDLCPKLKELEND